MDIKKEPSSNEEDSNCQVIEVVDLTKQVLKDAGQAMAKLNVSLKFIIHF